MVKQELRLINLANYKTVEEAIMFLLQFDNALNYKEALSFISIRYTFLKGAVTPLYIIADYLMGSNKGIAISVAQGNTKQLIPFLNNVAHNGYGSIPLIMKILQLHIQNRINDK